MSQVKTGRLGLHFVVAVAVAAMLGVGAQSAVGAGSDAATGSAGPSCPPRDLSPHFRRDRPSSSSGTSGPPRMPAGFPKPQTISVTDAPGYAEGGNPAPAALSGTVTPMETAGGEFVCTYTWAYVAAKADSFVTGNCHSGWKMLRTKRQNDSVHGWVWDGGYINGDYDGCGWLRQQDSTSYSTTNGTGCGAPDRDYCDYIFCSGTTPYTLGTTTDGAPVDVTRTCSQYANYRPWSSSPNPLYYLRSSNPGERDSTGQYRLHVRYLTKYQYGGQYWYMARDGGTPADVGQANWVFVPAACFQ